MPGARIAAPRSPANRVLPKPERRRKASVGGKLAIIFRQFLILKQKTQIKIWTFFVVPLRLGDFGGTS